MRLNIYAYFNHATDMGDQTFGGLVSMAGGIAAQGMSALAFAEPEMMSIGFGRLKKWMEEEPKLAIYGHYFEALEKKSEHVRSVEVEELLGSLADVFGTATSTHGLLANADLTFKPAQDSKGKDLDLNHSNIGEFLANPDRELRRTAYNNYADAHLAFKNTMANCLQTGIKRDVFQARTRRYQSTLEASLSPNNLPVEVYKNVIATYRKNLPVWHRFWDVRKRALKLDTMHVYDSRTALTKKMPEIPYELAVKWITEGLEVLGKDYAAIANKGMLKDRWVDRARNKGKTFGAFSGGMFGGKPLILQSYDNSIYSLSTLAHEVGHSMHSYLSWHTQPFVYSDYSLFHAEVASNFHQAIVRDHLLKIQADRDFQIAVIEEAMANFYRYLFIMPSLSIFDLEAHERAERGEPLTFEVLTKILGDVFVEGYGPAVEVDFERAGSVWMQFSTHLYENFYTYQYTTGISAANALAVNILGGNEKARDNYLKFLKSGGSLYPLDALKLAGIDMSSPEPVEKAFSVLNSFIDRLEKLVC
jgi:oligoendopeptidase F